METKNALSPESLKALKSLTEGQTLLLQARKVNGGKFQLEFAEIIENPYGNSSALNELTALLNADDERFSARKARRAWKSGSIGQIKKIFGIDLSSMEKSKVDTIKPLNILNPVIVPTGKRARVIVIETTTPEASLVRYAENEGRDISSFAKRAGKDGDFITHQGMHIFSNTYVVSEGKASSFFLEPDKADARTVVSESIDQLADAAL